MPTSELKIIRAQAVCWVEYTYRTPFKNYGAYDLKFSMLCMPIVYIRFDNF